MKRAISLLLVLMLVVGMFAACQPTDNPKPSTDPKPSESQNPSSNPASSDAAESETALKLAWFQSMGIDTLFENPQRDQVSLYPKAIFEQLAVYDVAADKMIPLLATEWGSNDACTEWWITVREGVKWHDGEDFTVDDVVFSIYSSILNAKANTYDFKYVEGYQALVDGETDTLSGLSVDGNKITMKMIQAVGTFDKDALSLWILPEHLLSDSGAANVDTDDFWKKPIGTGAYMVNEVNMPDYFTATRFDGYWGAKAGIKNLMFTSFGAGGSDAAIMAMLSGNLDFLQSQLMTDVVQANMMVEQNKNLAILSEDSYSVRTFSFNVDQRPDGKNKAALATAKGRKAISLLVDEETIQGFYPNQAVDTNTLIPTKDAMYASDLVSEKSFDAETAKQMLTEAGWDFENDTLEIAYYYDDQTTKDIMALIEQDMAKAGVKCTTHLLVGDLEKLIYVEPNYDILYAAGAAWAASPADMYLSGVVTTGGYTFIGDKDARAAKYDPVWDEYVSALTFEDRKAAAVKLQTMNFEDCYTFPIYSKNQIEVYNATNLEIPMDVFAFSNATYMKWDQWKILY